MDGQVESGSLLRSSSKQGNTNCISFSWDVKSTVLVLSTLSSFVCCSGYSGFYSADNYALASTALVFCALVGLAIGFCGCCACFYGRRTRRGPGVGLTWWWCFNLRDVPALSSHSSGVYRKWLSLLYRLLVFCKQWVQASWSRVQSSLRQPMRKCLLDLSQLLTSLPLYVGYFLRSLYAFTANCN